MVCAHSADKSVNMILGTRPAPDDSDPEGDLPGPPKKKRRRQALSCTGTDSAQTEMVKEADDAWYLS